MFFDWLLRSNVLYLPLDSILLFGFCWTSLLFFHFLSLFFWICRIFLLRICFLLIFGLRRSHGWKFFERLVQLRCRARGGLFCLWNVIWIFCEFLGRVGWMFWVVLVYMFGSLVRIEVAVGFPLGFLRIFLRSLFLFYLFSLSWGREANFPICKFCNRCFCGISFEMLTLRLLSYSAVRVWVRKMLVVRVRALVVVGINSRHAGNHS